MKLRSEKSPAKTLANRKRARHESHDGFMHTIKKRSHEKTNRRLNSRANASVWAAISIAENPTEEDGMGFFQHAVRNLLAVLLLPFFWVTAWTFLSGLFHATVEQGVWQSARFWYFAIGAIVMLGWFWSKLGQSFFLYMYVFGHELTHAAFVKCFGGKIIDMEWSSQGGYVTTDKTNWVIALSPYFVPFWSMIAVIVYAAASLLLGITPLGNLVFYGVIGATWAFHLAWTLWMIPRDQPDLKDNGTFLSLVLISFGNLIVLVTLLCLASPAPLESMRGFGYSLFANALTWGDTILRWCRDFLEK